MSEHRDGYTLRFERNKAYWRWLYNCRESSLAADEK
jgi:hypothetical protein